MYWTRNEQFANEPVTSDRQKYVFALLYNTCNDPKKSGCLKKAAVSAFNGEMGDYTSEKELTWIADKISGDKRYADVYNTMEWSKYKSNDHRRSKS
jgi:hypothetical protein